jgi:hypothetical protein
MVTLYLKSIVTALLKYGAGVVTAYHYIIRLYRRYMRDTVRRELAVRPHD